MIWWYDILVCLYVDADEQNICPYCYQMAQIVCFLFQKNWTAKHLSMNNSTSVEQSSLLFYRNCSDIYLQWTILKNRFFTVLNTINYIYLTPNPSGEAAKISSLGIFCMHILKLLSPIFIIWMNWPFKTKLFECIN